MAEAQVRETKSRPRTKTLAWRDADEVVLRRLRDLWHAAIKANVPPAPPIPASEVPKRLRAIKARRHDCEVREEAAILTAADRGIAIDRRGDADPEIVLCTVLADKTA